MLGLMVTASQMGGYVGDVPETDESITVDGNRDDIYEHGLHVDVKHSLAGICSPHPARYCAGSNTLNLSSAAAVD